MNLKTQMEEIINTSYSNMAGLVVLKNGETVYESYYKGYVASDKVHVTSVTKSIFSALVGIAKDKGYIGSLDEKVLDYFPDYPLPRGERTLQQITIKDMMTMTAPYKGKTEPYAKVFRGEEWVNGALNLLGGKGKIGDFRYSPMVGLHVLSGILVKATGQTVLDFAIEHLFSPLSIEVKHHVVLLDKEQKEEALKNKNWEVPSSIPVEYVDLESQAFLKSRNISGWIVDPEGMNTAAWGLTLTPRDMAKIGQLYLDRGMWEGKQILSEKWIEESTKEQSICKEWKLSYGYLWWVLDNKDHIYAAMGDGGNMIYVNAKKGLVIAIASSYMQNAKDRRKLIKEYIEPAFE